MTQARLLDIAVREFGLKGLEGATTRGIAAAADTAMSSITYHYGGKEGLYLAAADHIAEEMASVMAPTLIAERGIGADDPAGARAAIHRILDRFVDKMAGETDADSALFIMREQMNPTEAFDRIYAGLMGQMLERLADLICVATGQRERRAAGITAITLLGQVMTARALRASLLRLLAIDELDAGTIAALRARISTSSDAILDAMITEPKGQR